MYKNVTDARKRVKSLKGMTTNQVKKFVEIFNALESDGMEESSAIPLAISRSKKLKKSAGEIELNKAIDEEKRIFTAVVLRPNVPDAHGDIYDEEVVEEACHEYTAHCRKATLQHLVSFDKAYPVESYIAKSSFQLGEGEVLEGDWVMAMKIDDDEVWQACKDGVFTGFSVECLGKVEDI